MQSKIFGDALFDYNLEKFTTIVLKLNVQFRKKGLHVNKCFS